MRRIMLQLLLVGVALPTFAKNEPKVEKVTVEQLEQALAATHGRSDVKVAQQLLNMELTERPLGKKFSKDQYSWLVGWGW